MSHIMYNIIIIRINNYILLYFIIKSTIILYINKYFDTMTTLYLFEFYTEYKLVFIGVIGT